MAASDGNQRTRRLGRMLIGTLVVIGVVGGAWLPASRLWSAHARPLTVPSTTVTTPPAPPRPRRVLLVGDSMAWTLGFGFADIPSGYGLFIDNQGTIGCGIVRGGPYNNAGTSQAQSPRCDDWPQRWRTLLQGIRPDVAAILAGRWELMDR